MANDYKQMPEEILFPEDITIEEPAEEKPKKKKHILLRILGILLLLVVLVAAGLFVFFKLKLQRLHQTSENEVFQKQDVYCNTEAEDYLKKTDVRYRTILIYGVDARNSVDLLKNTNADSEILLVIDQVDHEFKMVSLHRDMFTERYSGGYGKLTEIYAGYGVKESMDTINQTLDLHVTDYVAVNWNSLQKVIDLLGGLDLQLTSAEVDFINFRIEYTGPVLNQPVTYLNNTGDGVYHLNGTQVVCHCSNRFVGRDDLSRAERQRTVLTALLAAAKTKDLKTLNTVIDTMLPDISTNIGAGGMAMLAFSLIGMHIQDSSLFPFHYVGQKEMTTSYVYCDTLTSNVSALHEMLYGTKDYVPSKKVKEVSDFIDAYRAEHP